MITKLQDLFINANEFINSDNLFFDISKIEGFDFSTNVAMRTSKQSGKNPIEFAQSIVDIVKDNNIFENIEVAKPGFINVKLNSKAICEDLNKIFDIDKTNPKKIVVDYSSPNIAKKMHIGHLRSTVIGDSIVKLLKHFGNEVIGDSHIGDWGTQFGKLIVAYQKWLDKDNYQQDPIAELQRIYVKFHEEEDEALLTQARESLVKLQKKEEPYFGMWKEFVQKSLDEYAQTYHRLGIKLDYQLGESFYNDMMKDLVKEMMDKKVALEDQGAKVVFFDEKTKIPPAIIQKKDGGFLYTTSDVATAKYRKEHFKVDQSIVVTDSRQANHFKQIFAICDLMEMDLEQKYIPFGVMSLETGSISTRGGNTIDLTNLLDEGYKKALAVVNKKNPSLSDEEKDNIANVVSVGAIKYFDLSHQRTTNITFTWDKALSFSGNSAPYIQYTYTRINSLLNKVDKEIKFENIAITNDKEREIVKELYQYGKILKTSLNKLELHHITSYLFKLTSTFNSWYADVKILNDEEHLNSRLYIAKQVKQTIKEGLSILGIDVLERM